MPSAGGTYQQGYGGTTVVNGTSTSSILGGSNSVASALTSLRSGVLNNNINVNFLVQFLHQKANATVLAEPQITIADNDMGKLFVGQSVPIQTGTLNPATGGNSTSIAYRNVGVIIELEPHINDSNDVALRVRAESSTIDAQQINAQVVIDSAQFRTELTAHAGETLVLGGIIQKQLSDTSYKTPILGSIPVLKYIFSKHDKSGTRTELLVFLRPKVVRTPAQARALLDEVKDKMPLIQKWELTDPESKQNKQNDRMK
jgi:general secretion pathway protein D